MGSTQKTLATTLFVCASVLTMLGSIGGCAHSRRSFEIRHRDPLRRDDDALREAYREELSYIAKRRMLSLAPLPSASSAGRPRRLTGIAYSGGGIRSASFSLGATQSFEDSGLLEQFDYMSAVSGGAYFAGWFQAHYGAQESLRRDDYDLEVSTTSARRLLEDHGDHVEHLRTHTGFLNQGGWWESGELFKAWLWRWPIHFVLDDILHLRGSWNFHHVSSIYRDRIEGTYFRGELPPGEQKSLPIRKLRLADINEVRAVNPPNSTMAPYLIINGNLLNRGRSLIWDTSRCKEAEAAQAALQRQECDSLGQCDERPSPCDRTAWPFEFTRDFVGSDATGYLRTKGFGAAVEHVEREDSKPVRAEVDLGGADQSPFQLSSAVAASGAAFDSIAVGEWIDLPFVSEATQLVGGLALNLHLGLDVPNFARHQNGVLDNILGFAAMTTYQRAPSLTPTDARWLDITDGGHYENLGVLALLRRGTECIVSLDAGADPDTAYEDLKTLRRRVREDLQLSWDTPLPSDGGNPNGAYRFQISKGGEPVAAILYLKASADADLPHLRNWTEAENEPTLDRRIERIKEDQLDGVRRLQAVGGTDSVITAAADRARQAIEAYYSDASAKVKRSVAAKQQRQLKVDQSRTSFATASISGGDQDEVRTEADGLAKAIRALDKGGLEEQQAPLCRPECEMGRALDDLVAKVASTKSADKDAEKEGVETLAVRSARFQHVMKVRFDRAAKDYGNWDDVVAKHNSAVARVLAFKHSPTALGFPHNSTLVQWYSWERFEAYRLLGQLMADTYLERLPLTRDDTLGNNDLNSWCRLSTPSVSASVRRGDGAIRQ